MRSASLRAVEEFLAYALLQNCFNSVTMEGFWAWNAYLSCWHSVSMEFKSGLWLGFYSPKLLLLFSHPVEDLLLCIISLSCFITWLGHRLQTDDHTFSFWTSCMREEFIVLLIMESLPKAAKPPATPHRTSTESDCCHDVHIVFMFLLFSSRLKCV